MKIHYLKIWPDYFDLIYRGEKTFELRKNDRDFKKRRSFDIKRIYY